ncbi:MAG: tRNA lysidine(34) synthetase TilS, partial [bacterium]|nr:tRNA lysidine(34) synthetase TilS [bacterium]
KALDVFAHIERTDALRAGSSNLEERARDIRYTFLRETAASIGARVIATGHNQDDQVETILLRLLRGSGLTGLIGMQAHQADLVRPLLELTRADIRHYAHAHKIPHRIDASNQDLRFVRNRVRRLLLPLLTKYFNPNLRETLTRSASLLAEDKSCLDDFTSTLYARLVKERRTTTGIEPSIDAAELTELPKALQRRLIRSMSKVADPQARLGHSVALEQALVALASHSKGVQFPLGGSLTLSRAKGTVRISFAK